MAFTQVSSCARAGGRRGLSAAGVHHLGDFAQAAVNFESALGLCRNSGNRFDEAGILTHIGDARYAAGELSQARQAWQQALAIYDDIRYPGADGVRAKLANPPSAPDTGDHTDRQVAAHTPIILSVTDGG